MKHPTHHAPEDILERWGNYFNKHDVERIVGLYHSQSTLIPTFSANIASTRQQIREYFIKAESISVEIQQSSVIKQQLAESIFVLSGDYIFIHKNCSKKNCAAQFTFLVDISSEKPIQHHHSAKAFEASSHAQGSN
jgi:hypothetical protein